MRVDHHQLDVSDEQLVEQVRNGDEEAWAVLLSRHTELLQRQARQLAQAAGGLSVDERLDEASEIYLFLAQRVRHSLGRFQGRCQLRTWIVAIIGNRAHVLKAWIRAKDPLRAEVRIPAILRDRTATEHEVFRRLVWGLDPHRIAIELEITEEQCRDVEDLIRHNSPRVAGRIRANRLSRAAPLRLDWTPDESGEGMQLADGAATPSQLFEQEEGIQVIDEQLRWALGELSVPERRLLCLLYDRDLAVSEVVRMASSHPAGMAGLEDANHCYYLKDRALQQISDAILNRLRTMGHEPQPRDRRRLLRCVEDLLRSRGVPMHAHSERGESVPLSIS